MPLSLCHHGATSAHIQNKDGISMKLVFVAVFSAIFLTLSACSSPPSENALQTTTAQTQIAPSQESTTSAAEPSPTPKPRVSCPDEEVISYLDKLDLLLEEFDDTVEIAGSTSRMGLAPVIQDMQSQKRDARRLDRPECANYLQDLVVVGIETKIDAFISFLSQASDTVVARKLTASDKVRDMINDEISAFKNDPLAAYEASQLSAKSLVENAEQVESFTLPDGWVNISLPGSDKLILSIPDDWTYNIVPGEDQFLRLNNNDETLTVMVEELEEGLYTEFDSDRARLFNLQTFLETADADFYSERSAEVGLYALNRGYVVEFLQRYTEASDIKDNVWAIIVTPDNQEVLVLASTSRDDFAQIDMLMLQEIYGSIRVTE